MRKNNNAYILSYIAKLNHNSHITVHFLLMTEKMMDPWK